MSQSPGTDLARLRAFVERVKGRHREWSTLADGIRCHEDYQLCPCDAARLAALAEGLLGVVEEVGHQGHAPDPNYDRCGVDGERWPCVMADALAALAALEVGDGTTPKV